MLIIKRPPHLKTNLLPSSLSSSAVTSALWSLRSLIRLSRLLTFWLVSVLSLSSPTRLPCSPFLQQTRNTLHYFYVHNNFMYVYRPLCSIVRPKYYNGSKKANWPVKVQGKRSFYFGCYLCLQQSQIMRMRRMSRMKPTPAAMPMDITIASHR